MYSFKTIEGFPDYTITRSGKVWSKKSGQWKLLKTRLDRKGYNRVRLYNGDKIKQILVHRLVAMHFIEGDQSLGINHRDANKLNNRDSNLEWATCKGNYDHAVQMGLGVCLPKPAVGINEKTGTCHVFESSRDAERRTGVRHDLIARACKGLQHSSGGFLWEYLHGH